MNREENRIRCQFPRPIKVEQPTTAGTAAGGDSWQAKESFPKLRLVRVASPRRSNVGVHVKTYSSVRRQTIFNHMHTIFSFYLYFQLNSKIKRSKPVQHSRLVKFWINILTLKRKKTIKYDPHSKIALIVFKRISMKNMRTNWRKRYARQRRKNGVQFVSMK